MLRHINDAAAAFAKPLHQFVAAQCLADGFARRVGQIELDGGPGGGRIRAQRLVRLVVRSQQGFQPLAQGLVLSTDDIKKRTPLGRRFLQREGKEDFFAVRIHGCWLCPSVFSFFRASLIQESNSFESRNCLASSVSPCSNAAACSSASRLRAIPPLSAGSARA